VVVVNEFSAALDGLKRSLHGLRIAHVSDLHFRRWDRVVDEAQRLLRTLDYDLLVATGDFAAQPRKWVRAYDMCRRFFGFLQPRYGAYAVLGNHDHPAMADQTAAPFRLLRNEHVRLNVNGSCVVLAGVEQTKRTYAEVASAIAGAPTSAPVILLAHYPSTVYHVPADRVRLVLSGHTHGGQIRVPGMGCLWTNDRIPRRLARGLHKVAGTCLHVSAGLGVSPPILVRNRCPPELSIITLSRQEGGTDRSFDGEEGTRAPNLRPPRELAIGV